MNIRLKDARDAAYSQGQADAKMGRESRESSCPAWLAPWYAAGRRDLGPASSPQFRVVARVTPA